jgi:hypothetical protein
MMHTLIYLSFTPEHFPIISIYLHLTIAFPFLPFIFR